MYRIKNLKTFLKDLLFITDDNKLYYVYIKDFNKYMCNKTKKHFCRYCLKCFSILKVLVNHKEVCLKTNGIQSMRLRDRSIKFNNYFKQLALSFKIYSEFESALWGVQRVGRDDRSSNGSYTEKYEEHIPCGFAYKIVCIDDKFIKMVVLYRGKKFSQQIYYSNT